ncbi:MAG TPA: copper resistance CopC family protein, partial [Candidatus Limnocylindria bacterium]|nr:copper resistance CopC family protein [Candidatus Limnocylindria bacterium]
ALALAPFVALAAPAAIGWRAAAHAQLVASSPGAGEVVSEAPARLVLVFSEPLEGGFSGVDLSDAGGNTLLDDAGSADPSDPHQLLVEVPPLADGVYTVTWRTLSAADGHTASGFFSFGVGEPDAPISGGGVTHASHGETAPLAVVGRWLGYLGLLAGFGVPIVAAAVLRRPLRAGLVRALGGLLLVSAAATFVVLVSAALGIEGGDAVGYLFDSRTGALQLARAAAMALGGGLVIGLASRRTGTALAVAAATALGATCLLVAAGHAAAEASLGPAVGQVVHVAAVAVWLSGVAMLALLSVRPGAVGDAAPAPGELVPRFSALALVSIGLVAATGIYAAWSLSGTLIDPATEYGTALLVKLGLAGAALVVGGLNYLVAGRRLGWLGGLRRRLLAESALAAAVLLVTGILSTTPPVETAEGVPIAPVPDAFGRLVPGMSLELVPGRPGVNRVAVDADGALGAASLELVLDRLDTGGRTRVPLRHTDASSATAGESTGGHAGAHDPAAGPDRFVADAIVVPPGSAWDASVRVLSGPGGDELSRQRYAFEMGERGVARGRATDLLDVGTGLAAMLVLGGAEADAQRAGGSRLPRCEAAASRLALLGGGTVALLLGVVIGVARLAAVA